jgi:hypothetical protein
VSGRAFVGQPVAASSIGAADVLIGGHPPVTIGGDYWHTATYPVGANGSSLIRVVTSASGVLESSRFSIGGRFLAFRLGGSGAGVSVELRIPQKTATALRLKALDAPGKDGFVAVMSAAPRGSDPMVEVTWDMAPRGRPSLVGAIGKIRLRVRGGSGVQRLLFDNVRLSARRPVPFHRPLWGWADIHCHPMAQAGFGGLLAGHMHGPVEDLGSCLPVHGAGHGNPLHLVALAEAGGQPNDGSLATPGWTTRTPGPDDELAFSGWPAFSDLLHIKTHQAWIRRAYEGGQRLMVALVVHNRMLDLLSNLSDPAHVAQTDRDTVEPQVQMLREFVAHNADWCGLAATPGDARKLIESNRMAFVLGLETDSVNGWLKTADFPTTDTPANRAAIHTTIHDYFGYLRGLGIVQVNLVHLSDNAFGGMAVYDFMFIVNSLFNTGALPVTAPWSGANQDELVARQVTIGSKLWSLVESVATSAGIQIPPAAAPLPFGIGDRNTVGLTLAGEEALLEAMRLGMVIDTDHMSELGEATAFDVATKTVAGASYPLIAAHNGPRALAPRPLAKTSGPAPGFRRNSETWPSEAMKSETQLGHIKSTGGIFGQGIAGADARQAAASAVRNNLPGTSRTLAQGYEYVAGRLEAPVALGTDWNALLAGPGPRFGPQAGHGLLGELGEGDAAWDTAVRSERWLGAQDQVGEPGVRYDTPLREWRTFRFDHPDLFENLGALDGRGHLVWQALALLDAGVDRTTAEVVAALTDPATGATPSIELADGLAGVAGAAPPIPGGSILARAAFLAVSPGAATAADTAEALDLASGIAVIRGLWAAMHASGAPAIRRDTVGPMRDFDFNIDGLAHYGLLPDMLQDLMNVGLAAGSMAGLFRSAERYIQVWERSVATGQRIPH